MWHRVAALLGRTVEELQQAMSSAEFVQWCAFYSLEPWGFDSDNWRMGVIGATVANYSGRVKKAVKPSDFFPKAPRKLTPKEARQLLKDKAKNG
jgi:hypothetical protein